MLPFARPAVFHLTSSTPSPVTYDQDISPKHSLYVHSIDGQDREWVVQASVSKISIYDSKNLTLRLPGRIVTSTIDVWQSSNIKLVLEAPSRLGTLQLDPTLDNVRVEFVHSSSIGKVVVAPAKDDRRGDFGLRSVSFRARDADLDFVLADDAGNLHDPRHDEGAIVDARDPTQGALSQWVLSWDNDGWKLEGLQRGASHYPIL